MKRKIITLCAALVMLGAAVVALLTLTSQEPPIEEAPPAAETIYVLGGETKKFVKSVDIENEYGSYSIVNGFENAIQQQNSADSRLSVPGLPEESLNQSMLKSVMNTAGGLSAKRIVAEKGADLAMYGLDKPSVVMNVNYEGGSVKLQIGGEAPGGGGFYATTGGDVYLIDKSAVTNIAASRFQFVGKTMTLGNSETNMPKKVTLSGEKFPEPVLIEKTEDTEVNAMVGFGAYRISSPVKAGADISKGVPSLQGLYGLTASEILAQLPFKGDTADEYGLAEPYLAVKVETEEQEGAEPVAPFEVIFSEPDGDGNVTAQVSGSDFVYRLAASSLPFFELTLFDYQDKMPLMPMIDNVAEIEVKAGDAVYLFKLEGEGDELKVTVGDTELDTKNFRQFYQTLIAARYDEEIEPGKRTDAPDSQPALSYTYRYKGGQQSNTMSFYEGPSRRFIVSVDGGGAYYVQSMYVDKVLADIPLVLANETVKTYI